MKETLLRTTLAAALAVALGSVDQAQAQLRAARPSAAAKQAEDILRLRKIEGVGSRSLVKTPEFTARTNITRGTQPQREWAQILVEYDTYPDWIDELTFVFHAIGVIQEEGKRIYSLYKTTVRYGDIEKGRGHMATAFVRPQALERYGDLVGVAVEISYDGTVIAEDTETGGPVNLPPDWWKNERVTGSPDVKVRSGYLLDRSKSPFALINIDDHEVIK